MRLLISTTLASALIGSPNAAPHPPEQEAIRAVAVVSALEGKAVVFTPPKHTSSSVGLFDWLLAGSVVQVDDRSTLTLTFVSGLRFELAANTKATVTVTGPANVSGTARALPRVPAIPRLAAIAAAQHPGTSVGAIRLRHGNEIDNLYPRAGTSSDANATVLRFSPAGERIYNVTVDNAEGRTIFERQTGSGTVSIPPGVLKPGQRYFWSVKTSDFIGAAKSAQSEFSTLSSADLTRRRALRSALEDRGDSLSLALAAEIDRRLGLLIEARRGFAQALAKSPADSRLRRSLDDIDTQLSESNEHSSDDAPR